MGHGEQTDLGEGLKLKRFLWHLVLSGHCRQSQAHILQTTFPWPRKPADHRASVPTSPGKPAPEPGEGLRGAGSMNAAEKAADDSA